MSTSIGKLLNIVYARCVADEDTGCMTWTGAGATQSGNKCLTMRAPGGKNGVSVRRLVLETSKRRKLNPQQVATYTCGNTNCVRLEHLAEINRSTLQRRNDSEFNVAQRINKSKRISDKVRLTRAKLTAEMAQEILGSNESQRVLGLKYGVGQSTIGQIKRGLTWCDYTNPFLRLAA